MSTLLDFLPFAVFAGLSLSVGAVHLLTRRAAGTRPAPMRPSAQIIAFVPRQSPVGFAQPQGQRVAKGG